MLTFKSTFLYIENLRNLLLPDALCGGVHMRCWGGCLTIHKVLFACRMANNNPTQFAAVKGLCQGKEDCTVEPGALFLRDVTCPKKDLKLWLTYSCNGGGNDKTRILNPKSCGEDQCNLGAGSGTPRQQDIPLDCGFVNIRCQGGCIFIHKVLH